MSTRKKLIIGAVATLVVAAALLAHAPRFRHRAGMHALIAGYLDLTESQKAEAEAIFKSAHESAEPLVTQLKQGHEALVDAIKTGKSEQELGQLTDQQGALVGKVGGIYATAFARFYATLTPEQREKADELLQQFREFRGHRFGRHGPF